jgi:phospholipase/lecithinase/hemolysin
MQVSLFSRRLASVAALAVAALSGSRADAQAPTSLTFFGDSFTDTGNGDLIAAALGFGDLTPSPPYAIGRASNGMIWTDYLAAAFGRSADARPSLAPAPFRGNNYAVGTATTGTLGGGGLPIGMQVQLDSALTRPVDPNGLFVLFGGANDLRATAGLNPFLRGLAINAATDNIVGMTTELYASGARNFLIPLLPDLGKAPFAGPDAAVLSQMTSDFNALLSLKLGAVAGGLTGSNFMTLNLDNLFTNILYDASTGGAKYGITNTTIPCFLPGAPSCSSSIFVDELHPTSTVHKLIAEAAFNRVAYGVDVAVVPEPGTVLLVGCGLMLCGVAARRNSKVRANNNAA